MIRSGYVDDRDQHFMQQALALARRGVEQGHGGPFGAVVVIGDRIVGEGWNRVIQRNDPTAHAEVLAIRAACEASGAYHLADASLYTTCEPCPMCMGALYWARIGRLVYGASAEDAAAIGFDDRRIRDELQKPIEKQKIHAFQLMQNECRQLFRLWWDSDKRIDY
jgi:guanine deaminase